MARHKKSFLHNNSEELGLQMQQYQRDNPGLAVVEQSIKTPENPSIANGVIETVVTYKEIE